MKQLKGLVAIPLTGNGADPYGRDRFGLGGVRKLSAAQQVYDRLVTAIAVGAYSPGDALPAERDLAGMLGVSRATLRQAITQVVELGLLESRRGRGGGTFVTRRSWQKLAPDAARRTLEANLPRLEDLFDYRCMVEGMIARAAAQRCTDTDRVEIRALLEEFAAASSDMSEARSVDKRFHARVATAARNPHLLELSHRLTAEATLGFDSEPYTDEFYALALTEHRQLADAVCAGDSERANDIATYHFRITALTLRSALEQVRE